MYVMVLKRFLSWRGKKKDYIASFQPSVLSLSLHKWKKNLDVKPCSHSIEAGQSPSLNLKIALVSLCSIISLTKSKQLLMSHDANNHSDQQRYPKEDTNDDACNGSSAQGITF